MVFAVKNAELPESFHQNWWILDNFLETISEKRNKKKKEQKGGEKEKTNQCNFENKTENAKKFDDIWLKFGMLSGAKACKSCRSRQELSNEYSLSKFGFDTAENKPLKVCQKGAKQENEIYFKR